MADRKDLYHGLKPIELQAPAQVTADAYSKYVDTDDLGGILFVVHNYATTADSSNYITPKLYGYTGDTPGTFTNYTACATTELNGAFAALKVASTSSLSFVSLSQHLYRYYCIFLDETLTADSIISVVAYGVPDKLPATAYTATTGAVT